MIGLSHGGSTVYQDDETATEVLVGTMDGVVTLSRTAVGEWVTTGHSLQGLHIHAIVFADGLVFAGAYKSGVFASADGGTTWDPRDIGIDVR
ncbi:MAG: hypothetical protein O3B65_03360, partial [Chloroflexi bacterium]|nr:hypothetical protein [Chloroflexota bacterium]